MRRLPLLLLAAVLLLAGCGLVRVDGAGPEPVAAPAAEQLRQTQAATTAALLVQADRTAASTPDETIASALRGVADDARAHLDALGGLWRPPPPARTLDGPVRPADPAAVLAALREAGDAATEGVITADGPTATLLASIAVARVLRADALAAALGEPPPDPEEPTPPDRLDPATAAQLCRTLDALGYTTEVRAARAAPDRRTELAEQARSWRAQAQQVAEAAGVAGTADDPRSVAYALPDSSGGADAGTTVVADAHAALLPAWLAQVAGTEGQDRARALARATAAARAAGPVPSPFPGLR